MKRNRASVTLNQKYAALKELDSGIPRKKVMEKYGVKKNTVSLWVKSKEKIYESIENKQCTSMKKYERKSTFD